MIRGIIDSIKCAACFFGKKTNTSAAIVYKMAIAFLHTDPKIVLRGVSRLIPNAAVGTVLVVRPGKNAAARSASTYGDRHVASGSRIGGDGERIARHVETESRLTGEESKPRQHTIGIREFGNIRRHLEDYAEHEPNPNLWHDLLGALETEQRERATRKARKIRLCPACGKPLEIMSITDNWHSPGGFDVIAHCQNCLADYEWFCDKDGAVSDMKQYFFG